ncbi:transketolase [candidate division WWE3 bacterium CG10_big_fil_rev_8_21_14_0_10_48_23]|uniref:Transketolase n=1 Tax=candidate division WWE3 bacterium CG_4_9_14_0_2_um_filter_48_10 TaxID=1975078 RepID=A0A2M8EKC5_UNCKA|nr:MAG: transketolase [candidate division WWE3 bacterium CG_4_10_14_0_2_um_filter_47_8]PJC23178.1 MAG: transketolase [candidate division WWE3 bacterium CG_4_9_14_0_2_um_filter_48_10]PJE51672.1 MAG: transketolase [candidate division WWE3 bacterium CG10_big_fil_rev_8_21_14_0_10_48_23]
MSVNREAKLTRNLLDEKKIGRIPTRDGYGEGLVEAGKRDPNVVVLCADLSDSTRSLMFQKVFPERFIEVGIAEQNMMGLAAGLALAGKVPFISTYAVFCPGINWSQLRVCVCQNDANVKLTGAHAGISVGPDGMSHQGLEDMAITRCLPGLVVLAPCDYNETRKATLAAAQWKGPVYLRFAREKTPVFTTEKTPFKIGQAELFWTSSKPRVTIVACGPLVYDALLAAEKLEDKGLGAEVINCHTIKPLDTKTILKSVKKTGAVVTVEEHQIIGGLGSAVAEILGENYPVPMRRIGVYDRWGESGEPEELLEAFGLTSKNIVQAAGEVVKAK